MKPLSLCSFLQPSVTFPSLVQVVDEGDKTPNMESCRKCVE